MNFFKNIYENKKIVLNEKDIKKEKLDDQTVIKKNSILLSLYTCYYFKISDLKLRSDFDSQIKSIDTNYNKIISSFILEKKNSKEIKEIPFSFILELK